MKNSKFIGLFRTLEKEEILAFRKYLKQQHSGDVIAHQVFEYVSRCHPHFSEKKLDLAFAYRKIFKTELNDGADKRIKILNTLSDLHLWLKDFLRCEKMRDDSFESHVIWLSILQNRKGMEAEFSRLSTLFFETIKQQPKMDTEACAREMVAAYFYYQQLARILPSPELYVVDAFIDAMKPSLETISLRLASERLTIKVVRPVDKSKKPAPAPLNAPPAEDQQDSIILLMYRVILQLVETQEAALYYELKAILFEHQDRISPTELRSIIRYLYNYAAEQIRSGQEIVFGKELHQLNIFGARHHFFSQGSTLTATEFANIINTACTEKDFAWAERFILDHMEFLPSDTRKDVASLAYAMIQFEQGFFEETLQTLESIEFKDIHFIIRSRSLILRSYYELDRDVNVMWDYATAFKAQLGRSRKPHTSALTATLEFIRVFSLLLLEETDKQSLTDIINENANLYFRTWLSAQLVKYKPRHATRK